MDILPIYFIEKTLSILQKMLRIFLSVLFIQKGTVNLNVFWKYFKMTNMYITIIISTIYFIQL